MSISGNNILAGASGNQGYEIARSLRFNDGDSAYLNFTPGSAGNQKTWTWSAWIKRSANLGSNQNIFNPVNGGDGVNEAVIRFDTSNRFQVYDSGTLRGNLITTQVFRDVSAWYHIVVALDTTQATASNRLKIYVNGEQVTAFDTETYPSQDTTWGWNGTQRHDLGRYAYGSSTYFDGYIAEAHFVDGTQLAPSNFGETDLETGAWIPKKYSGSHGSQGWYLDFSDNSGVTATTLGKDSSGNGNNWTPNNFSVTAGTGNDSLEDTPTNNWCTLNSILGDSLNLTSDGNLRIGGTANNYAVGTIAFPSSGKYYAEATLTTYSSGQVQIGICPTGAKSNLGGDATAYLQNGSTTKNGASSTSLTSYTQGDVIGIAVDVDNSTVQFYKNNTAQTALTGVLRITEASFFGYLSVSSIVVNFNFGQRAFAYTPPTGFKALNTANLPVPTVKNGTEYFNTVLWTGNSSTQAITGVGFQPSFVWAKARSVGYAHNLFDAVRGATKSLVSSSTAAEITLSGLTSFDSDGFSLGSAIDTNLTTHTYVGWNWKAGGSGSANTDGSISSTVSVNADAGFSIVSYTGSGANATIGHNLGVAPSMVIVKNRDAATDWSVYAQPVIDQYGAAYAVFLQATSGAGSYSGVFNSTAPTSTVFSVGTSSSTNTSSQDYIAYCFSEVEGYSKVGKYTGNGSTDGTFIYTGFKPAFVMTKRIDSTGSWYIFDNTRAANNETEPYVLASAANVEATDLGWDLLSNGFKHRTSYIEQNTSSGIYIYMAFAETPFKYANAR